jgi:hypothetical protein
MFSVGTKGLQAYAQAFMQAYASDSSTLLLFRYVGYFMTGRKVCKTEAWRIDMKSWFGFVKKKRAAIITGDGSNAPCNLLCTSWFSGKTLSLPLHIITFYQSRLV